MLGLGLSLVLLSIAEFIGASVARNTLLVTKAIDENRPRRALTEEAINSDLDSIGRRMIWALALFVVGTAMTTYVTWGWSPTDRS